MQRKILVWDSVDESFKPTCAYPMVEHIRAAVLASIKLLVSKVQDFGYNIAIATYFGSAVLFLIIFIACFINLFAFALITYPFRA